MDGKSGRIDIVTLLGGKPKDGGDDEAGETPQDMACHALWKSLKSDDYGTFKEALDDYLKYREEGKTESGKEESSGDKAEGDDDPY